MTPLDRASEVIRNADCVLIGAGAGMSAAAGLDYTDEKSFAARFPGMLQYGARNQYQLMGYPFQDEALKWGYQAAALDLVYRAGATQPYQDLKALIGDRDYFVVTSNVDRYFHKNGFEEARIFTPQGDYEWLQCLKPCTTDVWDATAPVGKMMESLNRETQKIEDIESVPTCPNCGGAVFMNVRGGNWFIESRYRDGANQLNRWIEKNWARSTAVLEVGCGYNTPGVVRWPLENLATQMPKAQHIRVNRDYAETSGTGISMAMDAGSALASLCEDRH